MTSELNEEISSHSLLLIYLHIPYYVAQLQMGHLQHEVKVIFFTGYVCFLAHLSKGGLLQLKFGVVVGNSSVSSITGTQFRRLQETSFVSSVVSSNTGSQFRSV